MAEIIYLAELRIIGKSVLFKAVRLIELRLFHLIFYMGPAEPITSVARQKYCYVSVCMKDSDVEREFIIIFK